MDVRDTQPCSTFSAFMQVAKKALIKEPGSIIWSVNSMEQRLHNIQQMTDPPLDLNTVMKYNLLRSTPACHAQMAQWLRTNLQLSEEDLRRCLSKGPGILARSPVGTSVAARARLASSQIVYCGSAFRSSVWRLRPVSGSHLIHAWVKAFYSSTLQELQIWTWLQEFMSRRAMEYTEAGFTSEDFKRIVCQQPTVVGLSFQHNVLPKLLLLQGLGVKARGDPLTEGEVRRLVVSFPCVLGLSSANIESKLNYLVNHLQREGREILTCPAYLASSMEGRIVPRATYLQALELDQQTYTLSRAFTSTDSAFCKTMGVDMKDYIAFKDSRQAIGRHS